MAQLDTDQLKALASTVLGGVEEATKQAFGGLMDQADMPPLVEKVTRLLTQTLVVVDPEKRERLRQEVMGQIALLTEIERIRASAAALAAFKAGLNVTFRAALGLLLMLPKVL